jgi:hypothetical protein
VRDGRPGRQGQVDEGAPDLDDVARQPVQGRHDPAAPGCHLDGGLVRLDLAQWVEFGDGGADLLS